ncbi:MAG: hypothetical protein LBV08_08705 [Clostridiales bacterium]|jgi:hypothetical protein|nr:hypothetical protein [Clostridiales bacterium]
MVKRIFKHLKPKYFKLRVMLGMDDPCLTGEIVGAAAVFSGVFHKNIFLKGNFLEKEAIVKLGVNGRVRLGSFLVSAIRFIFYIPVMKAIVKLVKYYFKLNKQKKIQEDI